MYRELAPPPDLAGLLACVWLSRSSGAGAILPDGCSDIVWTGDALRVAGPATRPAAVTVPRGTAVFGVRFRIGAAGPALGMPADELLDADVALEDVWPEHAARLAEGAALRGLAGLVDALRARVAAVSPDPLTRAAAVGLARPGARVAELGTQLGISERQLRRRFDEAVGYGPKTLARVLRFQRFLALAGAGDGLAGLALDAGYADQAHLTRECVRLSGDTPVRLLANAPVAAGERGLTRPIRSSRRPGARLAWPA